MPLQNRSAAMNRFLPFLVLATATLLSACQPNPASVSLAADEKMQITRAVWSDFEAYKSKLGRGGGAFVVTETGTGSGYSYCPTDRCRPGSYTNHAFQLCENAGVKCVIFAKGRDIVIPYEVVE
jgi:hypothetical protein